MVESLITVVTVNYNTAAFLEVILYGLYYLTKNTFKVIICDNGSSKDDITHLISVVRKYDNMEVVFRLQDKSGSVAHAEALDLLIGKAHSKYVVVMDSDCTFLLKDWDQVMIKNMDKNIKIIGSTSPIERKGIRIGGGDFPLPFVAMFDREVYQKLDISCQPKEILIGQDTCWEWKTKFKNAGFDGIVFSTKNTRDYKNGPFGKLTGVEEYYLNNELIASHFGRGSSKGQAKYFKELKLPFLGALVKRSKGKREIIEWIKICQKIIERQVK